MDVVLMLESLGKLPQGAHENKCRSKLFERKFSFQGKEIIIQEDFTGDVGEIVWEMCLLVIQYVESHTAFPKGFWRGKRVLELGSGTGLLGIVLALLGADIYVTDIPPVLELLEMNVSAACELHSAERLSSRLHALELDWFKPIPTNLQGPWDFVMMADVVYDPSLFAPLVNTLVKLHDRHTNLILGYEWRHNTDRGFFALLCEHFEMHTIDPELYTIENGIAPRSDISLFRLQMHSDTAAQEFLDFGASNSSLSYWYYLHHGLVQKSLKKESQQQQQNLSTEKATIATHPMQKDQLDFGPKNNHLLYWWTTTRKAGLNLYRCNNDIIS